MERVLRKPLAFILTLSLVFGAFAAPSFADSSIYSEASIVNGVDTSFEKQSEISEVKAQSYEGSRILNSDSHTGRFSLKLGKAGLTESVFCHIIDSSIDLSKYNKVSMWVKPKGYNIPFTLYTDLSGERTTIGSIEVANLKADVWQLVSFDLSSVSATEIPGLYTYANNNKSLLIDDICFTKSYTSTDTWDLNASGSNTLPTEMAYQNGVGITLKTSTTDSAKYQEGVKVASIENPILGDIADIHLESTRSEIEGNLIPTGGSFNLDYVFANPALYSISNDGEKIFYYNKNTNHIEVKNQLTNSVSQIYSGPVKVMKTNENGSLFAMVDNDSNLYLVTNLATTNASNFAVEAKKLSTGNITNIIFSENNIFYVCNGVLYIAEEKNNYKLTRISDYNYVDVFKADQSDASQVENSIYRYKYYREQAYEYGHYYYIKRHDNFFGTTPDGVVLRQNVDSNTIVNGYFSMRKCNSTGSMVLYNYFTDYLIINADTSNPTIISLGSGITSSYFVGDMFFYYKGSSGGQVINGSHTSIPKLNYSLNIIDNQVAFIENYSSIYLINKSYSYDKELLVQFSTTASVTSKPESKATIVKVKFSTQPNQVIAQMENGDIYSIDTRTKTSRLIISKMILHDVLSNGRLLLSDMVDTGRFLIYDTTTNNKEVFRLDNRNTSQAFTIQFNEDSKTVYYLNNENKMQVLPLTGAEIKDKYALMLNNDNKWWVYKNNAWKIIYTGADCPSADLMDSMGMTAAEVNAITEKELLKLPENAKPDTLRIAVYFNSNSPYATPVLKSISVSTKDSEADLDGKTAYGTRIKEYNKADFRDISAIHVTENKDSTDEIFYFLVADDTPYSIRNGEVCDIDMTATQLFGNAKDNYMDVMTYGMNAKELADFPENSLKEILVTDNASDTFGIVAVIKTINRDTKDVKLDYALESLQKRFDDAVTTIKIILTDDTLLQYTSGEVSKEEIEKFADWVMDRKYNRGPVFFTFHVNGQYKVINYYMIKMFSVE